MMVQHNMMAEFTARQYKINDRSTAKHTKRLSSGYKVNTAADDAAALQISEKIRSQIRGLDKGIQNLEDGISLVQVADGAMNEIQTMLHRLKELAVHSANGTLTDSDRGAIQAEAGQIMSEIDRICESTEFNTLPILNNSWGDAKLEGMGLRDLLGTGKITTSSYLNEVIKMSSGGGWVTSGDSSIGYQTTIPASGTVPLTGPIAIPTKGGGPAGATETLHSNGLVLSRTYPSATTGNTITERWTYMLGTNPLPIVSQWEQEETDATGKVVAKTSQYIRAGSGDTGSAGAPDTNLAAASLDFSGLGTDYALDDLVGTGFNTTCQSCNEHYSIYFVDNGGNGHTQKNSTTNKNPILEIDVKSIPATGGAVTGADLVAELMNAINGSGSVMGKHYTQYAYNTTAPAKLYVYDNRTWNTYTDIFGNSSSIAVDATFEPIAFGRPTVKNETKSPFPIQCKSEESQYLNIYLPWVTRDKMGLTHVDLGSQESATYSLEFIDMATEYLNRERSDVGAYQNRMEHAIANNENTSENLQAAESLLRDTDMAEEMVAYTKDNILLQASQAMLSQANAAPSRILELLN